MTPRHLAHRETRPVILNDLDCASWSSHRNCLCPTGQVDRFLVRPSKSAMSRILLAHRTSRSAPGRSGDPWPGIIWLVKDQSADRVSGPVEVPEDIVEQVRTLCLALPEVTVRVDHSLTRTRSTAQSFDIRRRSFCLLVAVEEPTGKPVSLLVLRADPDEREALLSIGQPFFAPRNGRDRIGVLLTDEPDWDEIRELVTESYRVLAPKKLTALLD